MTIHQAPNRQARETSRIVPRDLYSDLAALSLQLNEGENGSGDPVGTRRLLPAPDGDAPGYFQFSVSPAGALVLESRRWIDFGL